MAKSKRKRARLTYKTADKFDLYEQSVQDPENDIHFIRRVFKKENGREPLSLREDFCGTAQLCADWVRGHRERAAYGLDLDQPTLDYGTAKHLRPLGEAADRIKLYRRNVLEGARTQVDVGVAFNFSYCVFKERKELLRYFVAAHRGLKPGGAFYIDLHGGPDAQIEVVETTRQKGFTYVWDQRPLDAVNGCGIRYIHFRFPDGTELKRAFTYDWRIWSLPELIDLFYEAGFRRADTFWEGCDEDGSGNGIFRKVRRAENEDSWIAYLVGWS